MGEEEKKLKVVKVRKRSERKRGIGERVSWRREEKWRRRWEIIRE